MTEENEIKALRQRLGIASQEELARLLGISVSTVQKWEQGTRTPGNLARQAIQRLERRAERRGNAEAA
jgi:DNA-binding transcriptional regulator YiaG